MSEGHAPGTMIVVVGPSGAGKDSLIDFARIRLAGDPRIAFVRRTITRASEAGGENHLAVSESEFDRLCHAGRFAVDWRAHGLRYGIPAETVSLIEQGRTLVANGSRAALALFHATYPRVLVVAVTADPQIIAARLANRGREGEAEIASRLLRSVPAWSLREEHTVIDNGGPLEDAGSRFVSIIRDSAKTRPVAVGQI